MADQTKLTSLGEAIKALDEEFTRLHEGLILAKLRYREVMTMAVKEITGGGEDTPKGPEE